MAEDRIERLLRVDTALTRSFIAYIAGLLATVAWYMFIATPAPGGKLTLSPTAVVLTVFQYACYIWYAIAAGAAAKELGDRGWKYVVWILVAPILAMLPIPIVSTVIGISPISIKFLLGGQLQSAIRQESAAVLHA